MHAAFLNVGIEMLSPCAYGLFCCLPRLSDIRLCSSSQWIGPYSSIVLAVISFPQILLNKWFELNSQPFRCLAILFLKVFLALSDLFP